MNTGSQAQSLVADGLYNLKQRYERLEGSLFIVFCYGVL
ncbi:MAG: hypothetical protein JWQ40_1255 [Segetibacter sp.]|nr:hypothetical protein [Segetibacter sp.]